MPVRTVVLLPAVRAQIADVLAFTELRFGARKAGQYVQLIEEALDILAADAERGRSRPEIAPDAWSLHLGPRTRHMFLYRIAGDRVLVHLFSYDSMDLPTKWAEFDDG